MLTPPSYQINEAAADRGYFTLTPAGTAAANGTSGPWGWNALGCCGRCYGSGVDDFAFATAMLEWAEANLCVDISRVYVVGFSNGGFMANSLGCRLAGRLAGVATMAASVGREHLQECSQAAALPFVSFHSLQDPYVPYNGNVEWLPQTTVDSMYRQRAGCAANATGQVVFQSNTTECHRYTCPDATMAACTVKWLNHCWLGGRSGGFQQSGNCVPRPGDLDATGFLFDFFESL